MPIYEYRCNACKKKSSFFLRSMSATTNPVCRHCGSASMERVISRVAVLHSSQDIDRDYDHMSWMDDMPDDGDDLSDDGDDYR